MLSKEVQQLSQGMIYTPWSTEQHKDHLNWFDLILLRVLAMMEIKHQAV
jgi:hypothetical protein